MVTGIQRIKSAWIEPVFMLLFFFNGFLFPEGITYSLLLAPIWLYLLYKAGKLSSIKYPLILIAFWGIIHIYLGVALHYYIISSLVLLGSAFFTITAYYYLNTGQLDLNYLFKRVVLLNFILTIFCIICFSIPLLKPHVWYIMSMSENIRAIPRLKMFTSEASLYSYILAPVAIWFYTQALFFKTQKPFITLALISIPLLLSLSFGVIGCTIFSGLIVVCAYWGEVFTTKRSRRLLLWICMSTIILIVLIYLLAPDNILFLRIHNMINGRDTSFRGRTFESFILADKIILQKSKWWGIGPGQVKLIGRDIIIQYYFYTDIPQTVRIPNAAAETIACFGYIGFIVRIAIELFLFLYTRVFKSPYRLWLFVFLFLFQFMGSYITNTAEYIFWVFAFSPIIDKMIKNKTARTPLHTIN